VNPLRLAPAARALNVNKRKLNTMKIPTMHGVIDRRILVNYRVNPDVLQACCRRRFIPSSCAASASRAFA